MKIILQIALHNLIQARRRTALLGVGLAFVTLMLVSLLGLSRAVRDQLLKASTTLSSGHINIAGFHKTNPSDAAPYITRLAELRQLVQDTEPDLDYLLDRYRGWTLISSETDSLQTGLAGIDMAEEGRLRELLQLAPESKYREGGRAEILGSVDGLREPDTVIIFASHAKTLNVTVGDQLTVITQTPDGVTNTKDVRIVAVAADIGFLSNWTIFTTKLVAKTLYNLPDDTSGGIHIFLKHPDQSEAAMARLKQTLLDRGFELMDYDPQPFWMKFETVSGADWIGQKLDLTYWQDEISFVVWILTVIDAVSIFLVTILLVIIGVGITNTMWIAVRERTGEIGTLRAIGMSRGRIMAMFLAEAGTLGLVATTLGALLALLIATAVTSAGIDLPEGPLRTFMMAEHLTFVVTWLHVVGAVLVVTLVTMSASLWPALRAARLEPVTAIQRVN